MDNALRNRTSPGNVIFSQELIIFRVKQAIKQ